MRKQSPKSQPNKQEPGRPRDPEVERRILTVALQHLITQGFARMSIDAIAAEAGVSKPTIYRRWEGKADLATAALCELRFAEPALKGTTAKERLTALLRNFRTSLFRPHGMALIGTVLAEEEHTPDLLRLFRERLVEPRRAMVREILKQAHHAGEIRSDADLEPAISMLIGSFYAAYLAGGPPEPHWPERTVELIFTGLQNHSR
ncbi:MAG: TetR/AcrR family transcriptional regulator [Bryobacterales bacterium]|nr:TetR/AcrR family transcriptional regulator [Bryobacterales bacterium]